METKNCLNCGKIIHKTHTKNWHRRKYCSSICNHRYLRKMNPERYKGYYNERDRTLYNKKYWKKIRKGVLEKYHKENHKEVMCINCNKTFMQKTTNQKYCSNKCLKQKWYLDNTQFKEHPLIQCLNCGKDVVKFSINQKFCSEKCCDIYDYFSKKEHYSQLAKLNRIKNRDILKEKRKEYHNSVKQEENKRREKLGLPLVGEGFKREMELYVYISSLFPNETIIKKDRTVLGGLELDIYLPNLNLAFEYMGRQHFEMNYIKKNTIYIQTKEQFEAQKFRDNKKIELCKEKGITLIHFNYDEPLSEQNVIKKLNDNNIKTVQQHIKNEHRHI